MRQGLKDGENRYLLPLKLFTRKILENPMKNPVGALRPFPKRESIPKREPIPETGAESGVEENERKAGATALKQKIFRAPSGASLRDPEYKKEENTVYIERLLRDIKRDF